MIESTAGNGGDLWNEVLEPSSPCPKPDSLSPHYGERSACQRAPNGWDRLFNASVITSPGAVSRAGFRDEGEENDRRQGCWRR